MSAFRFLVDENLPPLVHDQLRRLDSSICVLCIGDAGAPPPGGSQDPDIPVWLDRHGFCLVTDNRRSMPVHLAHHLEAGGHVRGVFQISLQAPWGVIIEDLHLVWAAADPDEYVDWITHIPLRPTR